jgi:hypothetical protein
MHLSGTNCNTSAKAIINVFKDCRYKIKDSDILQCKKP